MAGLAERLRRLRLSSPAVLGGMTPRSPVRGVELLCEFADENLGDPDSHPASREAFEYVARTLAGALFPGGVAGWLPSSGGTEGNLLGLYAARERGRGRVVYSATAHYSVAKAARILGMDRLELEPVDGYAFNLEELERVVGEGDVVVATVGTTETGYVDPLRDIAALAREKGALVHVDAAYAGPVARFLAPGKLVESLDPTVATAVVDAHKILNTPYHAGVLLAGDPRVVDMLHFDAPYVPSRRQPGLLGSRAGAPYAAAAVVLDEAGGVGGLERLAGELMRTARALYEELVERGPYGAPHEPETPVLCLTHPRHGRVAARLASWGYRVYTCPRLGGVRLALNRPLAGWEVERLASLLARAARG